MNCFQQEFGSQLFRIKHIISSLNFRVDFIVHKSDRFGVERIKVPRYVLFLRRMLKKYSAGETIDKRKQARWNSFLETYHITSSVYNSKFYNLEGRGFESCHIQNLLSLYIFYYI